MTTNVDDLFDIGNLPENLQDKVKKEAAHPWVYDPPEGKPRWYLKKIRERVLASSKPDRVMTTAELHAAMMSVMLEHGVAEADMPARDQIHNITRDDRKYGLLFSAGKQGTYCFVEVDPTKGDEENDAADAA